MGGTLNWFKGAAILLRRTIARMSQGDRRRVFILIARTAWIIFENQYSLAKVRILSYKNDFPKEIQENVFIIPGCSWRYMIHN